MSLRIQQLNADTTFLLTFSPPFAPEISKRYPGEFVILVDPWLRGHSSILHPTFQISHHTATPALYSLNELNQRPDLIIVSQDRPDHCHRETLCSLPKDTEISILATPAAAKKIRSWKYFEEDIVEIMKPYDPCDEDSVIKLTLPGYSSSSVDGEITIANVPAKRDVAGVHNAIGITYQPASTVLTVTSQYSRLPTAMSTITLPDRGFSGAPESRHRSRTMNSDDPTLSDESLGIMSVPELPQSPAHFDDPDMRPKEKVISIIYTPHGVTARTLESYIENHLLDLDALPVSALLHSLTVETNPWFMGGVVAAGAPGGVEVAKRVQAKYWVGAHDEVKDNKGMATAFLKTQPYDAEETEELLEEAGVVGTKVYQLDAGEVLRIPELKKTVENVRRIRRPGKRGLRMGMKRGQRMNVEDNVLAMPEPKRPMTAPNAGAADGGAIAPGTKVRIRREITDPEGRWI